MKKTIVLLLFISAAMMLRAQSDEPKPMKYENSVWYAVEYVKFESGKMMDAKKIIKKFESASVTSGSSQPEVYWFETGDYDMMVFWKFDNGPSDLEWMWSPDGVKWWKAFVKQEGSAEAAQKVSNDFDELVEYTSRDIVRKDN